MTAGLDWRIEGQPASPAPSGPAARQRRRLWLLLIGLALPLLALGGLMFAANRRQAELAQQVRRVAEMEEAARRSGNMSQFLALQDRTDEAWLQLQASRLKRSSFYALPELGLIGAGSPVTYSEVTLEDGFAWLEVTRTFSVTDSAGIARTVLLSTPQFYRPWGNGWVRTWPPPDWWLPHHLYDGRRLRITYPAREADYMYPLAARLDDWAEHACADWGCPDDVRYTVAFTPWTRPLLWLNQVRFSEGSMTLPSPALIARPAGAGSDDPIASGFGRLIVRALAQELSGTYSSPLVEALAIAEQARLGLASELQPDRTGAIAEAWRDGRINFIDGLRFYSSNPIATAVAETVMTFLRDTYPERGERALLGALRSSGPLAPRLANTLGLTPQALTETWLAFGQAHWSNTDGRAPPQGELALACGNAIALRDLASGMTQALATLSSRVYPVPRSGARPLMWSADGTWLAVTARRWQSYETVWLKNLVTGQELDLGRGWFVAWAPHGDHYALYRPALDQTFIYSLSGGPGQALPGGPSIVAWSPSGDRLVYVAPAMEGIAVTVWVAAGDGTQAHPLLRGFAPLWSPDGRWLAYLPASAVGAPALSLVDVSTGLTHTLLTTSDLSADLIAPGFASERTWVTAIYPAAWSPDSRALALWVGLEDADGGHMGLVTVTADGRQRRLWLVANWLSRISWSPDSRHLSALTGDYAEPPKRVIPMRVWITAMDGSAPATVEGSDYSWSPDGRWLAVDQAVGSAVFSADLGAVWRLPSGCKTGGWRPK